MVADHQENKYLNDFDLESPVDEDDFLLSDWEIDDCDIEVSDDESETVDYQQPLKSYQEQRNQQKLKEKSELHDMRKDHAKKLFDLICWWLGFMGVMVLMQGFYLKIPDQGLGFSLSDTVLIALITSTTATVLGLYIVAAYWLFGKRDRKDKKDTDKK